MISCIPNFITVLRIIGTFALLFLSPAELSFLIIYLVCGLTDILDGWLARKLKVTSVMGSRLDTAALRKAAPDLCERFTRTNTVRRFVLA